MNKKTGSSNKSEAEDTYKRALEHHRQGRLRDAVREYALTVRLSPFSPDAYNNFGVALRALGRPVAAITCYRRSIAIRPRAANVLTNLGNAFRDLGLITQAIAAHARALKISPDSANAHFNAALAYRDAGQVTTALEHFQKSLAIDPANLAAKLEMGISLLMVGEWQEGFQLLDARLKMGQHTPKRNDVPLWQGQQLSGRTILITHEGNPGTQIMIARFARNLKLLGATVIMEAPKQAANLLRLSPDIDRVIETGTDVGPGITDINVDFQIPLLSLPGRLKTTIENIPNETPYLRPPVQPLHELEISPNTKLALGIVWSDEASSGSRQKNGSCKLEELMEIIALPGLAAFSLVSGPARMEIEEIGVQELVFDAVGESTDLAEIAGIIEQLDLVITVDSAVAHVAGAMGKPVWLLAAPGGDWCWLLERSNTPWYPSIKIFRKSPTEGWNDLASRVRKDLQSVLSGNV
ncbi:MAG: tetratricopeptide repeat protein [Rhodospirillaceae bacterium]|nr:tetratricopeptide repeat protein [Rhodospirillaceae bacterium]